ncbi:MAG: hypothetical protein MPJ50_12095 [Pirellulales bacterium]|nr:hypothetical protein [Pirellulales bacterium]
MLNGTGQLTLVEHSLCPLDPRASLVKNLVHHTQYQFSSPDKKRQTSHVQVFCPLGLTATDEFFLWGLLALTMQQRPEDRAELRATPHWCLRRLAIIDELSRRGGRQYRQFRDTVRRLSTVAYVSDEFYDPVRGEHREIAFGFFKHSLPKGEQSKRAWRIVWDPLFMEMVQPAAGQLRFDLHTYRQLDPASRRLFLFLSKVFPRKSLLASLDLTHLAVNLLGFSETLNRRVQKAKVKRCFDRLQRLDVVSRAEFTKSGRGSYRIRVEPGGYFNKKQGRIVMTEFDELPLWDTLLQIGFEPAAAARLMKRYSHRLLEEWADITQAAQERFGASFFHASPMAFLVDSVKHAARGRRTPPDWWLELKRQEAAKEQLDQQSQQFLARVRCHVFGPSVDDESTRVQSGPGLSSAADVLRNG